MSEAPPAETKEQSKSSKGFGNSRRRIMVEGLLIVGTLFGAGAVALWSLDHLAEFLAERLPPEVDVALGEQAWSQVAPESKRCSNPQLKRYVEALTKPLRDQVTSDFDFRFTVVDQPEVNAFALPGGFITVNRGLLENAASSTEIAAVLAHEMAHVTERHGTKRAARQLGALTVVSLLFGGTDFHELGLVVAGLAGSAYDRDQEAEADAVGRRWLMDAGISPLGMAQFFERMSAASPELPALLSTHPDPGDRAEAARVAAEGFTVTRELPVRGEFRCR